MANNRGGLQPTPKDQAWDASGIHKDNMEVRIAQMEKALATKSPSKSMLWTRIENIVRAWT